jgi:hypothetical protein
VVDTLVHAKLRKLRMSPSEVCRDDVYLRRAMIDLIGLAPSVAEYRAFMADHDPRKRARLVDGLMQRPEFIDLWTMKWAERLQVRSIVSASANFRKATIRYSEWLHEQLRRDVPIDRVAKELLVTSGTLVNDPATNFYREKNLLLLSENMAQLFMGMRIQCAQCHNHPFDRWTQNDYYGLAAFFAQLGRKPAEDPQDTVVYDLGTGETVHPVKKIAVPPKFLGGRVSDVAGRDRREALAEWLVSPDNTWFARNLVNIYWQHFFGTGIVDPVDDVRVSNPPSNPELLDALAKQLVDDHYVPRKLIRLICTSRTYQLSTRPNDTNRLDRRNFSHAIPRRIQAEVLEDCLARVTEGTPRYHGHPVGTRAVQLEDGDISDEFLKTFGRSKRETVCACEVRLEPTLSQALHMINGEAVNSFITSGGWIDRRLREKRSAAEIIDEVFIRALSREPTAKETARFAKLLQERSDPKAALEDIFWAVLNSKEFVFNH